VKSQDAVHKNVAYVLVVSPLLRGLFGENIQNFVIIFISPEHSDSGEKKITFYTKNLNKHKYNSTVCLIKYIRIDSPKKKKKFQITLKESKNNVVTDNFSDYSMYAAQNGEKNEKRLYC